MTYEVFTDIEDIPFIRINDRDFYLNDLKYGTLTYKQAQDAIDREKFLLDGTEKDIPLSYVEPDMVNYPPHYIAHPSGVECIQITEHYNFNVGNAIKYLWRSDKKNGLEDLKKAAWYVNREIERLSK